MPLTTEAPLPPPGYAMTTAQILYRVPDFRNRVQEFLWRDFDLSPEFPELKKFLNHWKSQLDGRVLSVTITQLTAPPGAANGPLFLMN